MSTTSPNKLIVEPAYGDASWNTPLNANLVTLDQALGSSFTVSVGTGGTTTLTLSTPASGGVYWYTAQQLLLSPTGNLTSNVIVTIPTTLGAGTMGGAWIVLNNLTSAQQGSYTVTFQTATGTGVTIAQGTAAYVFSNGTNVYYADNNSASLISFTNPTFTGNVKIVGVTTVNAGSFTIGQAYTIVSIGTTDFTLIGASVNTVGITFVATGVGSGSGTATLDNATLALNGSLNLTGTVSILGSSGTTGQILTSNGSSAAPSWQTISTPVTVVRQTVQAGPGNGTPTFLPATSASLSITSQNISVSIPLIVSFANGFGSSGDIDTIGQTTSNLTWSNLTASNTNFLGLTVSSGILNTFSSILVPIYQFGGTIAVTNGQYTFDISQMKMFVGNGSTASQVNAVFVGEAVTGGSSVTSTVAYQYNGYYDSGYTNTLPATATTISKNSNLGVTPNNKFVILKCLTVDYAGSAVGQEIIPYLGLAVFVAPVVPVVTRNSFSFTTGSSSAFSAITSSGTSVSLTAADWAYRVVAQRGW